MRNIGFRNPLWDLLIFSKVRQALGGRIRWLASGAAPLAPQIHHFLQIAFGVPVIQGYGMTENFAGAIVMPFDCTK